jgi:hypothetical protein
MTLLHLIPIAPLEIDRRREHGRKKLLIVYRPQRKSVSKNIHPDTDSTVAEIDAPPRGTHAGSTTIQKLLRCSGPAEIARLVTPVVVDAVEAVRITRTRTNLGKKAEEAGIRRRVPRLVHSDPTTPVV